MTIAKRSRPVAVAVRNARDLSRLLKLDERDAAAIELRVTLVMKIMAEVGARRLTHAEAATRAGTSRSRMTAILNGAVQDVSTDLLLRILSTLGVRTRVTFSRAA